MRQTPELTRAQEKMRPGVLTLGGFLGTDDRPLADIINDDAVALERRGVSRAAVVDALARLTEAGRDIDEGEHVVDGRWKVSVRDDRGVLPSPWGDGSFGKGDTRMTDEETGVALRWNDLTLHMIRSHGFFGGKGSDYRIDPETVIDLFGLEPDDAE